MLYKFELYKVIYTFINVIKKRDHLFLILAKYCIISTSEKSYI